MGIADAAVSTSVCGRDGDTRKPLSKRGERRSHFRAFHACAVTRHDHLRRERGKCAHRGLGARPIWRAPVYADVSELNVRECKDRQAL
jgi:hypothetical protein